MVMQIIINGLLNKNGLHQQHKRLEVILQGVCVLFKNSFISLKYSSKNLILKQTIANKSLLMFLIINFVVPKF